MNRFELIEELSSQTQQWKKNPENLFNNQNPKLLIKQLHDNLISEYPLFSKKKNENLIINNMDLDQIWEQITLHLNIIETSDQKYLQKLESSKQQQNENLKKSTEIQNKNKDSQNKNKKDNNSLEQEEEIQNNDLKSELSEDDKKINKQKAKKQKKTKEQLQEQKMLEDKKFQEEMNRFLDQADKEDNDNKEGLINQENAQDEEDVSDDDELGSEYEFGAEDDHDKQMKASEFFKDDDDNDDNDDNDKQSNQQSVDMDEEDDQFENEIFDDQREQQLNEGKNDKQNGQGKLREKSFAPEQEQEQDIIDENDQIKKLEHKLINKDQWQQKGEISSKQRPINSLLEETLDFKKNTKNIQEMTQEYQDQIESMIKQRILDEAYDDRVKVSFNANFKENFNKVISQQKDQKGLGEIYEDEFKSQLNLPSATKQDKLKLDILNMFQDLCYKIDQLSNLSFTPKQQIQTAEIKSSVPTIDLSEKIPISVSNANLQNPKELFKPEDGNYESKNEMSHFEKQKLIYKKKRNLRVRRKELEKKKLVKQLAYKGQTKFEYNQIQKAQMKGKKITKQKNQNSIKFTKSSQFFQNLQNSQNNQGEDKVKIKKKQENLKL